MRFTTDEKNYIKAVLENPNSEKRISELKLYLATITRLKTEGIDFCRLASLLNLEHESKRLKNK